MSKIKRIAKEKILGIRSYKSKMEKFLNIGWRVLVFVSVILVASSLLFGFPFRIFEQKKVEASPSEITYTFATCTQGTNCWAYYGQDGSADVPVDTTRANWTVAGVQFSSGDYDNIEADEGTREDLNATAYYIRQIAHDFVIDIAEDENEINSIALKWNGHGATCCETAADNDLRMYLYNDNTSAWELVDSELDGNCAAADCDMTYTISSNIPNYIDSSGYLRFLVQKYEDDTDCGDAAGTCYKKSSSDPCESSCTYQTSSEDLWIECGTTGCYTGNCKGDAYECGYYTSGRHNCVTACKCCDGSGNCNANCSNTNWGANLYGCTGSNKRCYGGVCKTCGGYMYSDGCSGCAGQGGNACWRMGAEGSSCDTACSSYGGCVAANWNDDTSCTVGKALYGCSTCYSQSDSWDPRCCYSGGCTYRTAVGQSCSAGLGGLTRFCVCQY